MIDRATFIALVTEEGWPRHEAGDTYDVLREVIREYPRPEFRDALEQMWLPDDPRMIRAFAKLVKTSLLTKGVP
jgi:hypothetical protein